MKKYFIVFICYIFLLMLIFCIISTFKIKGYKKSNQLNESNGVIEISDEDLIENELVNNNIVSNNIIVSNYLDNDDVIISNNIDNDDLTKYRDFKEILKGKEITMVGDSLIDGYGNEKGGLDVYLSELMPNAKYSNFSKSGSTVTDNTGDGNIIMANQAKDITGNPDIILFNGGVNDIIGYDMGYLNIDLKKTIGTVNLETNNYSNSSEVSVISDFEEVIHILKTRFPDAKLFYLQLCLLDDESINVIAKKVENKDGIKQRRDEFFSQIKLLCEKCNVNYLDLSSKFVGTSTKYRQEDLLHINENGFRLIAPDILNFISIKL